MVTRIWNVAGSGDWKTAANWDSGVVPTPADLAIVLSDGTPQVTSAIAVGAITDYGTIDWRNAGGSSISTTLKIYGTFNLNAAAGNGGASISVNGALTVARGGTMTLGNSAPSGGFTTVGAASLVNFGKIALVGTASAPTYLNVQTAAGFSTDGVLNGEVSLTGGAVIRFANGSIKTIARTGQLELDGAGAVIAITGSTGSNSALSGLAANYNFMFLTNGASLALSGNFTNYGRIFTLGGTNGTGAGGGSFSAAGILTNRGGMGFGDGGQTAATNVSVQRIVNYGELSIGGSASAKTTIRVASAAGFGTGGAITGSLSLYGNAAIIFDSGKITRVASGANLTLSGSSNVIATAAAPTTNSAFALNRNDGAVSLVSTTMTINGNFTNGGFFDLYTFNSGPDATLTVNGIFKNAGTFRIGSPNPFSDATSAVTVDRIDNTGRLEVGDSFVDGTLTVRSAAGFGVGGKVTGTVINQGQITFASGAIYDVVAGAELAMEGGSISVAGHSALGTMRSNAGKFSIRYSTVQTSVAFTNSGAMTLENGSTFGTSSTLFNSGTITFGSDYEFDYTSDATVTAARLQNSGTLAIYGSGATDNQANIVRLASAAGTGTIGTLTGTIALHGYSRLQFASGQISTIEGTLTLDGNHAFVSLTSAPTSNSALVGLRTVRGHLELDNAATLTLSQLDNDGTTSLDAVAGSGGAMLTVTSDIVNDGTLALGNTTLSASDHMTATGIDNRGTILLTGNGASQARLTLDVAGFGRTGLVTGHVELHNNALVEFDSGRITGIASGASLLLDGAQSIVALTGNTGFSTALTGLTQVDGALDLRNGAKVTLYGDLGVGPTADYQRNATVHIDTPGSGGSRLDIVGDIDNASSFSIGNALLGSDTIVLANSFINEDRGYLLMQGANNHTAIMSLASAAGFGTAGTVSGTVNLTGDAAILFNSPGLISEIETGAILVLDGAASTIQVNTDSARNSALKGLSANFGRFEIDNGATVTTTVAFTNYGEIDMDYGFGPPSNGGLAQFTVGGRFTNEGSMTVGDRSLTGNTTITAISFLNDGHIDLLGNDSYSGQLNVSGAFTNNGSIIVYDGVQRFNGAVNGFGTIELDSAFVRFDLAVASTQTVVFDDYSGADPQRITLGNAKTFAATIDGFDTGDTIDLLTFGTGSTLAYAGNTAGGVLTVTKGANVAQLAFDGAYTASSFSLGADGTGGSLITHT